ncbi:nitroreductase family protein [Vibrio hepatarius]|uniref:nitroreductase family protein n=1 Tax=Vibrio hepatarius TaxID=171383 RepID=UPI00142E6DFD|nr:nitroreductase family protein [Vibrio hepatarius]NIY82461.1 NADPH-dependent oxidoreductase [Vibrio hepatarius]NVJ55614.1 nitroreductase family protein [Vibrionaceae bacterium]
MNPIIEQQLNRRSVRNFTGDSVKQEDLDQILKAAQQAPTSVNGQQISLVVIRDKDTIAKIAEFAGGQPQVASADVFITVVVDYHRAAFAMADVDKEIVINRSAEGIMAGAVDAGIMLNALQTAAESFGYGTTAIGGIRANPDKMVELLGLPANTFPLVGTTIGVTDVASVSPVKPRVPVESFAMYEKYDSALVIQGMREYDIELREWWDNIGLKDMPSYAESTSQYYGQIYFPHIKKSLESQGFIFQDQLD